ncbi:Metallocarboxypeptidase A-like protein TRV_02598, partial [Geodia barretti]
MPRERRLPLVLLLVTAISAAAGETQGPVREPLIDSQSPNAYIWSCGSPKDDELHNLIRRSHQLGLEIISASAHSVHVYSDAHDAGSLDGIGLKQCVRLTGLHNLFRQELKQNWHKLSDTAGEWLQESLLEEMEEQSLRTERSTEDKDCVLYGKCGGKEDHWFTEYHDLPEIYSWFEDLAAAHPQYLTVNSSIGKTYHNTDIMAIRITDKSDPQRKIKVYFQCLMHAREWISGPICMYIARHFANPDPETKELLKQIELIIVPVANPDGYHVSHRFNSST